MKRLSDEILVAFHLACGQREIDIASELLHVLEFMAVRLPPLPPSEVRRLDRSLIGAHERLEQIRARRERQRGRGETTEWVTK